MIKIVYIKICSHKTYDSYLLELKIRRSLSMKGCPHDNSVVDVTFKIFKIEFSNNYYVESLEQLSVDNLIY